jgi:predicted dinucleotide-binding enzyme
VQQLTSWLGPDVAGKVVIDATNPLSPYPGLEVLWNGTSGGVHC